MLSARPNFTRFARAQYIASRTAERGCPRIVSDLDIVRGESHELLLSIQVACLPQSMVLERQVDG